MGKESFLPFLFSWRWNKWFTLRLARQIQLMVCRALVTLKLRRSQGGVTFIARSRSIMSMIFSVTGDVSRRKTCSWFARAMLFHTHLTIVLEPSVSWIFCTDWLCRVYLNNQWCVLYFSPWQPTRFDSSATLVFTMDHATSEHSIPSGEADRRSRMLSTFFSVRFCLMITQFNRTTIWFPAQTSLAYRRSIQPCLVFKLHEVFDEIRSSSFLRYARTVVNWQW